jgi:cyclopropane fatty-acyl-phospholipid synthase-like methyltransferase
MEPTMLEGEKIALTKQPTPERIMQTGMGFWSSKALLSAVNLKLFTILAEGPLKGEQIKQQLKLETTQRHVYDWLDTLVSIDFLKREGVNDNAVYSNNADADMFLDKKKPTYMGGILEMANDRLYRFWADLEEGLLTGLPQNETKRGNMHFFDELYKDPVKLQEFMDAMSGIQMGNFMMLVNKFDFGRYDTVADIGGADGTLSIQICNRYPNIHCITFDLRAVAPVATKKVAQCNLSDRIQVVSGDFITDTLPKASVITMGNILHGVDEEGKQLLLDKVYDTLPEDGVFIAIENIIDNDRRQNTFGLLMSLNMLIENGNAFDYTMNDFEQWTQQAGFKRTEIISLAGPASAAIAYK